jgi:hypothetical protein
MTAKLDLLVAVSIPLAPLLACGSGSSKPVDSNIHPFDAPGSGSNHPCTASASYSMGSNQQAINSPAGTSTPHVEEWDGFLNNDSAPDQLTLVLIAQHTGFGTGDIKTGTYTLGSDDTKGPQTCGICAYIYTDLYMQGSSSQPTDTYFATGGSIQLTSVGTNGSGTLSGTVTNVTFDHVKLSLDGSFVPADSCSTTVTGLAFSAQLMPATFDGKTTIPLMLHRRYQ